MITTVHALSVQPVGTNFTVTIPHRELAPGDVCRIITRGFDRRGGIFFAPRGLHGLQRVKLFQLTHSCSDEGLLEEYSKRGLAPANPYVVAFLCEQHAASIPHYIATTWITRNLYVKMFVLRDDRGFIGETGNDNRPWPPNLWYVGTPM